MSYAPNTILAVRALFRVHIPQLTPIALGIVGDDEHAASGTSYHLGADALKSSSYSIVESSRDRNGLTNAAAALDIGDFKITVKGKVHTLHTFNAWLVAQCKAGTEDTKDIREVIYSLDGQTVKRWDRLARRTSGDLSHRTHTHVSWFRDSENSSKTAVFRRWFISIGAIIEEPQEREVTEAELITAINKALEAPAGQAAIALAAGKGVHGQRLGKSDVTIGQALQTTAAVRHAEVVAALAGLSAAVAKLGDPDVSADELREAILEAIAEIVKRPSIPE